MQLRSDVSQTVIAVCCDICGCRLAPARQTAGPLAYWVMIQDGALVHLCTACHAARNGGVKVVAPHSLDDRWMPLLHTD